MFVATSTQTKCLSPQVSPDIGDWFASATRQVQKLCRVASLAQHSAVPLASLGERAACLRAEVGTEFDAAGQPNGHSL